MSHHITFNIHLGHDISIDVNTDMGSGKKIINEVAAVEGKDFPSVLTVGVRQKSKQRQQVDCAG